MCVCRQVMLVWKCVCVCTQAHTAARCHAPWALFKNYNIEQQQETHKNQTKYCIDKHIWWHNNNKRDKNSNNVQSSAVQRNCLLTFVNICFCHVFCCAVVLLFCCLMQHSLHLSLSLSYSSYFNCCLQQQSVRRLVCALACATNQQHFAPLPLALQLLAYFAIVFVVLFCVTFLCWSLVHLPLEFCCFAMLREYYAVTISHSLLLLLLPATLLPAILFCSHRRLHCQMCEIMFAMFVAFLKFYR